MKILCIGEALIDMICTDKGVSLTEGTNFVKKTGGAPTNVAAAIAALGGGVDILAKVGNDPFGDQLISELTAFGVGTQYLYKDNSKFTTIAFVSLMHNGERDFVFSRGADGELDIIDVSQINIHEYNVVHFGSATAFLGGKLKESYYNLLKLATNAGLFISFDPNYRDLLFRDQLDTFKECSWDFLAKADFFKVSDQEAMLLTNTNQLEDAIQALTAQTTGKFAVTLGKDGTSFRMGQNITIVESIEVNPVDTTGAGDAFVGAVLYQLNKYSTIDIKSLTEKQWLEIVKNANIAGAKTCEYLGAMEAFKQLSNTIF